MDATSDGGRVGRGAAMTRVYGDHGLGARLGELVGGRHPIVAAATVTGRGSTVAAIDARPTAAFEIGSLSKGITGLLYADALARGRSTVPPPSATSSPSAPARRRPSHSRR